MNTNIRNKTKPLRWCVRLLDRHGKSLNRGRGISVSVPRLTNSTFPS